MQSLTSKEQAFRDHVMNFNKKKSLTYWEQGCPKCGKVTAIAEHEVNDFHARGQVYARLSMVCTNCNQHVTEIWNIN